MSVSSAGYERGGIDQNDLNSFEETEEFLCTIMVAILLLFSLVLPVSSLAGKNKSCDFTKLLCLPSQIDTVWQVWNSSSYCSHNTVIYKCVSENAPVINWDILEQGTPIASWTVSHFSIGFRRESEPIQAVLEVTYSNSTFIVSTILLKPLMDPQTFTIRCNSIFC